MSKRNAGFRNTVLGGTASGAPVPAVPYMPPETHRGDEVFRSDLAPKQHGPPILNSDTPPTVPVLTFRNNKGLGSRHTGKAKRDLPVVDPNQPGGVILHVGDPPGEMPTEYTRGEATELLDSQYAPQMGYDVVSVDQLTPEKKNALYELLFVSGGYIFYALFIARTQRFVLPVIISGGLSWLFFVAIAIVGALVVVAQVDIDLSLFTIITVSFMGVVPFTCFAVSVLEFSRKNTDLSIWHKTRVFMPLVVTIVTSILAIICLAVHNKTNGNYIDRTNINSYSSLCFCFTFIFILPTLIGPYLIPAVISAIYPECQSPTSITLAPDTVRRIRNEAERIARGGVGAPKNV